MYATYEKTVLGCKQFGLLVHERNYQMAYVLLDTSAILQRQSGRMFTCFKSSVTFSNYHQTLTLTTNAVVCGFPAIGKKLFIAIMRKHGIVVVSLRKFMSKGHVVLTEQLNPFQGYCLLITCQFSSRKVPSKTYASRNIAPKYLNFHKLKITIMCDTYTQNQSCIRCLFQ